MDCRHTRTESVPGASVPSLVANAFVASWSNWQGRAKRREFWIGGGILGFISAAIVYGGLRKCAARIWLPHVPTLPASGFA